MYNMVVMEMENVVFQEREAAIAKLAIRGGSQDVDLSEVVTQLKELEHVLEVQTF